MRRRKGITGIRQDKKKEEMLEKENTVTVYGCVTIDGE
jgi:hypothetical protein